MNKFTRILAFILIFSMTAGIATSEQVVPKQMISVDGKPVPEQAINFAKLEISPPYINFMLQSGESKETTITIKNWEKMAVNVRPHTSMAPHDGNKMNPEWIKVTPESTEIPAGGSQKFIIKITLPVDAPVGKSGVHIAFIDETMPAPYPTTFPDPIHALQVSLDIHSAPKMEIMTNEISDQILQGEKIYKEIALQETGGIITGIVTTSNGTPVADAYVYTQGPGYGGAITDINGNYKMGGLADGDYIISVTPPYGRNLIINSTIVHVFKDETVVANIILQTGSIITGIVTSSNGTPIAEAYVYAQGPGCGSAITDINGNYIIGGLTDGNYIIIVSPPYGSNFIGNSTTVHVSKDETVIANIILRSGSIIAGIVASSNGTPVAGAYIAAQGSGYGNAMTDINGNYMMGGLTDGNYIIGITLPYGSNLISNSTVVHVSRDETVIANIILQNGSIITGIITTSNGTPVANAYVYTSGGPAYGSAMTDSNGNYMLGGLKDGKYIIGVSPPYDSSFIHNSTMVHVSKDETVTANIILKTGSIITGIITTSNGTPVADAYIFTQGPGYGSTMTDSNGNYMLGGLEDGDYIIIAGPPYGNLLSNSTMVHVSKDETVIANIILQNGSIITGIVTASNGTPIENAFIYAQGSGYGSAMTDINGNYMMGGLIDGDYIITVSPPYGSNFIGNSTMVRVSRDETVTENIILQAGGIITGIVTASNGTPIENAYIYAQGSGYGSAMTDINGNYMIGGLMDGNYIITVSPPYGSNFIGNSTTVHVSRDETVTENIILQTGSIITGIVTAFNGTPVANAYIFAQGSGYGSALTDINGNYMIGGLMDGNYIIAVSPPYGSNIIGNYSIVHISRDETVTANIILEIGGIITGIVTSWNGTPVANANIYAQGQSYGNSFTDIYGNYTIVGLQAGDYVVYAYPPYGSDLAFDSTNVTVEIGGTSTANIVLHIMDKIPPSIQSVELRGEVAEGTFLWDAYNFPAFFYDFQGDVKTETLNISYINGRIIPTGQLIYSTTPEEIAFAHPDFGKYQVIGLMTGKYFSGYTSNTSSLNPDINFSNMSTYANGQLHKVLIDDDTSRSISVGGTYLISSNTIPV